MSKVKELLTKWKKEAMEYNITTYSECIGELKQALTEDFAEIERLLDEEIEKNKKGIITEKETGLKTLKECHGLIPPPSFNMSNPPYSGKISGIENVKAILSKVLK